MSKKHYYAQYSPYGNNTASDSDALIRFDSEEERDAWVDADVWENGQFHRRPIEGAGYDYRWAIDYDKWREWTMEDFEG